MTETVTEYNGSKRCLVALSTSRVLENVGFLIVEIKEYLATEIFRNVKDLIIRLKSAPIISNFDVKRDEKYLERVEQTCKTARGFETEVHRVTIIAAKS